LKTANLPFIGSIPIVASNRFNNLEPSNWVALFVVITI